MIDAIIALIRGAADVDGARAGLMAKPFEFTEIQANYILDMQLRRLTQLEGKKLRDELEELQATIKELESILDEQGEAARGHQGRARRGPRQVRRRAAHAAHRRRRRDRRARPHRRRRGRRRPLEARATSRRSRPTRSGARAAAAAACAAAACRDDDYVEHLLTTTAHSYLLFFSNRGKVVPAPRARDPDEGAHRARHRAREPASRSTHDERIQAIIDTRTYEDGAFLFFATKNGTGEEDEDAASTTRRCATGSSPSTSAADDELVRVIQTTGNDDIFMVSRERA